MGASTTKQAAFAAGNIVALPPHRDRNTPAQPAATNDGKLTAAQREWLSRGLVQAGGKLPLFDRDGQKFSDRTIRSCIRHGWAEPWFDNPIKPDWLVCRLTDAGRDQLGDAA